VIGALEKLFAKNPTKEEVALELEEPGEWAQNLGANAK
jgi:hypothetical protein